jgi:hypothetical protein
MLHADIPMPASGAFGIFVELRENARLRFGRSIQAGRATKNALEFVGEVFLAVAPSVGVRNFAKKSILFGRCRMSIQIKVWNAQHARTMPARKLEVRVRISGQYVRVHFRHG